MSVIERYIEGEGRLSLPFTLLKNPKVLSVSLTISFVLNLALLFTYNGFKNTEVIFQETSCPENGSVTAFISGAVNNPGVYILDNSSVLNDLLSLAGGFSQDAANGYAMRTLNLSTIIEDNSHTYIPFQWEISSSDFVTPLLSLDFVSASNTLHNPENPSLDANVSEIDINNASKDILLGVKGIGSSYATKIVNNRPYTSKEDFISRSSVPKNTVNNMFNDYKVVF